MVTNVLLTLNVNVYSWWRHTLLQSRDYDVIQTMITHFCLSQMKVFMFTFWCIFINVFWKDWNITVILQLYDVVITSYINLVGIWIATRNYHSLIGPIKSLNCVSVVNILSRQNLMKITSKILFDDVIVTSWNSSAIHYNQKIEHAPMINCWKFYQVWIKTKKIMEGGGNPPPPPLDWATSKKLGLDGVNTRKF